MAPRLSPSLRTSAVTIPRQNPLQYNWCNKPKLQVPCLEPGLVGRHQPLLTTRLRLSLQQATHCESKEKIAKMAIELRDAADRYQLLEGENRAKATDLEKARVADKEARSKIRAMKAELNQAADIVSGKPFLLRTKFGDPKYAPLDQLWSSTNAYMDVAASAANATEYFKDQKDHEVEKLFWSQFHAPVHPLLLNERMAEWAELHRLSGLAMRSVVDHM